MEDIVIGPESFLSPSEQRILHIAKELCQELRIPRVNPKGISWADRVGLMRVPFGQALFTVFGEMILPKALMGRLEPEEWRPLIASSLIFRGKLQVKSSLLATTRMLLPAVPVMIAAILVLLSLGEKPPLSIVLTAVVGLISSYLALAILAWSSSIRYMKRVVMKADTLAAEHVDTERFLEVLKKIDSLGLEEKGLRTRLYPRPTIRERIRNLESYVEQRHGI